MRGGAREAAAGVSRPLAAGAACSAALLLGCGPREERSGAAPPPRQPSPSSGVERASVSDPRRQRAAALLKAKGLHVAKGRPSEAPVGCDLDLVKLYLGAGMDPDGEVGSGETLLDRTMPKSGPTVGSCVEIARLLLGRGAKANTGHLVQAITAGSPELFGLFLEAGADVNPRPGRGLVSPLVAAVDGGRADFVERLLAKGADPGVKDERGRSVLRRLRVQRAGNVAYAALDHDGSLTRIERLLVDAGARE